MPTSAPPGAGYRAPRWLPGGDLQTVVPVFLPLPELRAPDESLRIEVAPQNRVVVLVHRPERPPRGTLFLVHGMGGSADSVYLRIAAGAALERGWVVARMNLRNCGGTEELATTLYNAGQCDDLARVLARLDRDPRAFPRPLAAVGFSLGGAMLLSHAGRVGSACVADALAAVAAPVDLERCLRALERPRNWFYQRYYTRRLLDQLDRVRRVRPVAGPARSAARVRDLRRFDTLYTAPDAGYATAEAYYEASSAAPHLGGVRRPVLVVAARNDPIVPAEMFEAHHATPGMTFLHPDHGGHCGYPQLGALRCWAVGAVLEFLEG